MNNALLYLGGLLIGILALLFAGPHFVDWNSYRGVFEEEASHLLGRDVRVGGAVDVRLLPSPFVRFEKVRIADAGPETGSSIIKAESFTMYLSVPPLLRGVLEADRVELAKPVLQLAIDSEGAGNWRTLTISPGSLPFVPADVALQSVAISDGAVIISGAERGELARIDTINGELQAETLKGPYRFKGLVAWNGAPRSARITTAKLDDNGDLRFKALIDTTDTASSYVLDGRLSGIADKPKLEGQLSARLLMGAQAASGPGAGAEKKAQSLELKATAAGDTSGVSLKDISITLDDGGTPQLVTGDAKIDWQKKTRLDVALASRWIDLDRLAPQSNAPPPLEAARAYFGTLAAALPSEADTFATLDFEQVTLGGEPLGNVRLGASRSGGAMELKGVRATLPGNTQIELDGVLTPETAAPKLDGTVFVSGQSLMRFLAWGFREPEIGAGRTDGPFTLNGRLELGESLVAISDARAEVQGTPMRGAVRLGLGERRKLAVTLESPRIDAAQFKSNIVGLGTIGELLIRHGATTASPEKTALIGLDPATADFSLRVEAAEVVDGGRLLRDLDAEIDVQNGVLAIPQLKFSTPEGLAVEASGGAAAGGAIRLLVTSPSEEAGRAFVRLLDLDDAQRTAAERLAVLAPAQVAATLSLGSAGKGGADLAFDGSIDGGRARGTLRLAGGEAAWQTQALDATLFLEGAGAGKLVSALLTPGKKPLPLGAEARGVIKATGIPRQGLLTLADLTSDGLSLAYRGRVTLPETGAVAANGDLRVNARDGRLLVELAGLPAAGGISGTALAGAMALDLKDRVLSLSGTNVTAGSGSVSGSVRVAPEAEGVTGFTADLDVTRATVAGLLTPLLSRAPEAAPDPEAGSAPAPSQQPARATVRAAGQNAAALQPVSLWPDAPFDFSSLAGLRGSVKARIGSLVLEPGLTIGAARLEAALGPEGIKVTTLEGTAVGGRLKGDLAFERSAPSVGLKGALKIDVNSAKSANAAASPGDVAAFSISFEGRALSPAALVTALYGQGQLTLGSASIIGMAPQAVQQVAEAAVSGTGPVYGEPLLTAIKAGLKQGELKLGTIAMPMRLQDGALKLERVNIDAPEGRSSFLTTVDLQSMRLDSTWQIEAKVARANAPPERAYLPPVTVVYAGRLAELSAIEPQVTLGGLERELQVRKMERDVEQLEAARKADQERRQKALEAERARLEADRAKAAAQQQQGQGPGQQPPAAAPAAQAQPPQQLPQTQGNPLPANAQPVPAPQGATAPASPGDPQPGQAEAGQPPDGQAVPDQGQAPPAVAAGADPAAPVPPAVPLVPERKKRRTSDEAWRPFQSQQPY